MIGATAPPLTPPTLTVGFVQRSLDVALNDADPAAPLSGPVALSQCAAVTGQRIATLRFAERFGSALKKRNIASGFVTPLALDDQNVPGTIYNSESGFFSSALVGDPARGDLGTAGLADSGTRLKAVFDGIPAGVSVYVDSVAMSEDGDLARLTASETGPFSAVGDDPSGPPGTAAVSLVSGTGVAVWEVTDANPNSQGTLDIGIYVSYPAGPPMLGAATLSGGLAPGGGDSTGPVPRFADAPSGFGLFTLGSGPECDALCGRSCEDGDVCTGYDACAPEGQCVSPTALTGFPRAGCEIGRLEPAGVCGGETRDSRG